MFKVKATSGSKAATKTGNANIANALGNKTTGTPAGTAKK